MSMEPDRKTFTGGRPVEYTDEIGMAICGRLVEGESLRAICAVGPGMPDKATVLGCCRATRKFASGTNWLKRWCWNV
jgi:hypothetical protein